MIRASLVVAALLMLANPARAQYDGGAAIPGASRGAAKAGQQPSSAQTSSFETLTAGDRKVARALFMAQRPTTHGPAPLSLNQIAELKARNSWAKVFILMQSRGLIQAKTLGQVMNGYERQRRSDLRSSEGGGRATTLVVSGSGSVVASSRRAGAGMAHGGDETGETQSAADIAAADRPTHGRRDR